MSALPDTPMPSEPSDSVAARARSRLQPGPAARIVVGIVALASAIVVRVDTGAPLGRPISVISLAVGVLGIVLLWKGLGERSDRAREARDRRRRERVATVLAIAERLTRTFDRDEILATIVTETNRGLDADATTLRIVHDGVLTVDAWAGMSDAEARSLPEFGVDEGFYGRVLSTGTVWASDDVEAEPAGQQVRDRYRPGLRFAAEVIAPLVVDGRRIGALTAGARVKRHWTPDDVEFITAVATHASIALHNADLFAQTDRRATQLDVIRAASARMSRENTLDSVGRAIVEETRRIIDYHNARVYILEEPDEVVPIAFEGRVGEYEKVDFELLRTKLGVGFTGWVAQHGEAVLVDDANLDPRGSTIPGTDDVDESMLCVPMRFEERVVGVITLSKLGLRQFGQEDLRLLRILADHAATAVESVRLLARTQALAGELQRLLDMSSELAQSLDPRAVADLIARHVASATAADVCTISYWDRGDDRLLTWGCWPAGEIDGLESAYELAPYPETRRVLEEQRPTIVDVDDPAADPAEVALLRRHGHRALVMLPLLVKGASIGLVELEASDRVTLQPHRLELAATMANEAAMALENARLYEDARSLADRDPLTGFFNHRYLHERLGAEILRSGRSQRPLSVLMIDLDDFKLVNDTFGHLFGDRVLTWVAERIRSTLRTSDVAARYGGDEFAVILPETGAEGAAEAATRIAAAFASAAFDAGSRGSVPIGVSVGGATHPDDGRSAQALIAAADAALYERKRARRPAAAPAHAPAAPPPAAAPAPAASPTEPGGAPRRHSRGTEVPVAP